MSTDAFQLFGSVGVDVSAFSAGMATVDKRLHSAEQNFNIAGRAANVFENQLRRIPVVGGELARVSRDLLGIERGARSAGTGFAQMTRDAQQSQNILRNLERALVNNVKGNSRADLFSQFGVNAARSSPEAAFAKIITGLKGVEDESKRAALAAEVFGKDAAALAPTLAGAGTAATGMGVAFSVGAVAAGGLAAAVVGLDVAAYKSISAFTDYAGRIHDIGQESGLSAATVSTLSIYSKLAGKDIGQTANALEFYAKNVSEAAHGNTAMSKTFVRFGIDAKAALASPDQAARDLFDHLAKISNPFERLDAAQKLAGKSGKILANVAAEMQGSFAKAQAAATEWGVVLSEDDVRAADKFQDAMTIMGAKVQGIVYEIGRRALPEVQKALIDVNGALNNSPQAWAEFGQSAGAALADTIKAANAAYGIIKAIKGALANLGPAADFDITKPSEGLFHLLPYTEHAPPAEDVQGPGGRGRGGSPADIYKGFNPQTRKFQADGGGIGDVATKHGGGGHHGGGGGASAAEKEADYKIKLAQLDEQIAQRHFREVTAGIKAEFDFRCLSLKNYTALEKAAIDERMAHQLNVVSNQRAAAQSLPKGRKKDLELAKLREEENKIKSDAALERAAVDDRAAQAEIDRKRSIAETVLQVQIAGDRALLDEVNSAANQRVKSAEAIAQRLGEVQLQSIDREIAYWTKERAAAGENEAAYTDASNHLAQLEQQRGATAKQVARDIAEAHRSDLENYYSYGQQLQEIGNAILENSIALESQRISALTRFGASRHAIVARTLANDLAAEDLRHTRAVQDIAREKKEFAERQHTNEQYLEFVKLSLAKVVQEEERHQQERAQIQQQQLADAYDKLKSVAARTSAILSRAIDAGMSGGFKAAFRSILADFAQLLRNMALQLIQSQVLSLLLKLAGIGANGQSTGGGWGWLKSIIGLGATAVGGGGAKAGGIAGGIGKAFANGGFATGLALVGERGPELIDFGSRGAQVYTNTESRRMLSSGGSGVAPQVNIHMSVTTPDANSFNRSSRAIAADMAAQMRQQFARLR